ncbi:MAG: endonuclease MutS2 [Proteobacteria bacterium]|nr:endonuclease MutS2 [Pseudomonadota bacterium]
MDEHTLRVLEFEKIRLFLRQFATSEPGKRRCERLFPSRQTEEVKIWLREVGELREIIGVEGDIPIHGVKDIEEIVEKTRVENFTLTSKELLDIQCTLEVARRVKRFFKRVKDDFPRLRQITENIVILDDLEKKIRNAVGSQGEILDAASAELREIRQRIKHLREKIRQTLDSLLLQADMELVFQERFVTLRNNRYVLPVKSEYKNYLPGIVHDQSQSRATFFIEPLSIVDSNNELSLLIQDEANEEMRILSELTGEVGQRISDILCDIDLMGRLDLIYAKALLSEKLQAVEPLLNDQGKIALSQCRHPILLSTAKKVTLSEESQETVPAGGESSLTLYDFDNVRVVPVDIRMEETTDTLIITGANAGGKTVALKTLGLLTAMAQAGIHIPAYPASELAVFHSIFADIGDEQNIEGNLSTFSAHMVRINAILKEAGHNVLVLLDELGSGTDPSEGAALAIAILDHLREKGAQSVITTHLNLLKTYAYTHGGVENVSVEFDPVTLRPTFRLIYGIPGMSNALAIAGNLGISPQIIKEASRYLKEADRQIIHLMQGLQEKQRSLEIKEAEMVQLKEMTVQYQDKAQQLVELIRSQKEKILSDYEARAKGVVREVEEELKRIIADAKRSDKAQLEERRKASRAVKEKIAAHFDRGKTKKDVIKELEVGQRVRLADVKKGGVVIRADNALRKAEIQIGNVRIRASFKELELVEEKEAREESADTSWRKITTSQPSSQINVIGMRVDEAIPVVEKAIDRALLNGFSELEIIHGIGTGRLRKAIREYLKEHSSVKEFKSGESKKGGTGVTIVEIK